MKKLLVIDDTRQTADALVRILTMLGFEARAAYGPSAAMAILGSTVPDAIFVDINMPGVTGFDILLILGSGVVCAYTVVNFEDLIERGGVLPTTTDVVMGVILIITILEMARRTMGPALPILGFESPEVLGSLCAVSADGGLRPRHFPGHESRKKPGARHEVGRDGGQLRRMAPCLGPGLRPLEGKVDDVAG